MPTESSNVGVAGGMSFWEHLDALRAVLVKGAVLLAVLTIVLFSVMPAVFDGIILAPCHSDFILYRVFGRLGSLGGLFPAFSVEGQDIDIININLASQFFIHVSASFWSALVLSVPALVYLLWGFVSPALYSSEKKGVGMAFLLGTFMFYLGMAVGYFVVFPVTLRFLAGYQVSGAVPNLISLDSYMDNFLMIVFVMGVVFELPLLAWLLGRLGVITRGVFSRYRRHAVVALLVAAAFITPTGDPFTLMVVFVPVYFLWEAAAWLVPDGQ